MKTLIDILKSLFFGGIFALIIMCLMHPSSPIVRATDKIGIEYDAVLKYGFIVAYIVWGVSAVIIYTRIV